VRRLLRCKAVTIIAAIVSLTASLAVGSVATAVPALASVQICNVAGNHYCIGDPNGVNNGDPVVLEPVGRDITRVDTFLQYETFEVYQLQFVANTSQCVGVQNSTKWVTVRDCSGGQNSNTYWGRAVQGDGSVKWVSTTKGVVLVSNDGYAQQLWVGNACNGCYIRWSN